MERLVNSKIYIVRDVSCARRLISREKELLNTALLLTTSRAQTEELTTINRERIVNVCDVPLSSKEQFLKEYVNLIGGLNNKNQSLKWWSYGLSSKDYVSSPFYNELFMLICLIDKIRDLKSGIIIVIADSQRLASQLKLYYEKSAVKVIMSGFKSKIYISLFSFLKSMISSLLFVIRQYYRIIICALFLRGRRLFDKKRAGEKRYIVRSWSATDSLSSSPYNDIYFGPLHSDLLSKGINAGIIVGVIDNYLKAVGIMRRYDKPMPQEIMLNLVDPIVALVYCRIKPCKIKEPVYFRNNDITLLLNSCLAYERSGGQDLRNMIYYFIGRRLARQYNPEVCIFGHENYPWEKMMILGIRSAARTFIIGYQHSVLYQSLTSVLLSSKEKGIIPLPNRIVTVGNITKNYMEKEGNYDPAILRAGCSLSVVGSDFTFRARPKGKNLLVILGCYPRAKEMVEFVVASLKDSGFHLILRPHPASPLSDYADRLAFDLLTIKAVEISTGSLEKDFERSIAVLYDGSKVALEAMRAGLPVINITPFRDIISWDPLIKCPVSKRRADSKESLMGSLNEIVSMDEDEYQDEKNKAMRYSLEYLGPKNDDCISFFLK